MIGQIPRLRQAARLAREFVSLVGQRGAGRDLGTDIEGRLQLRAVARFAAGQMEGDRQAPEVCLEMDFAGEPVFDPRV